MTKSVQLMPRTKVVDNSRMNKMLQGIEMWKIEIMKEDCEDL